MRGMLAVKAHVRGGKLVLDEPTETNLPEGNVVHLVALEDDEEMDEEERERLDASLARSRAQVRAGQWIDADEVIRRMMARG